VDISKIHQAYKVMPTLAPASAPADGTHAPTKPFSAWLSESIGSVNQLQLDKQQAQQRFITGELNDVHTLMIASQKAELGLQLTVQVRNKMLEAYQEIMRMQV
jgi:flagellar hook-basal body complex protein FliE